MPGGGRVMVNVGTGNVLLQDDDMVVPHKGVSLAFRRTYNSQSLHDVAGSDGTPPGMYGNGWTNTFDAHVSGDANGGTLSVWDIDGARYDYAGSDADAAGRRPPASTRRWRSTTRAATCGRRRPARRIISSSRSEHPATCPYAFAQYGGFGGRLYEIIGRNRNMVLHFNYTWDGGNSSASGKISAIGVVTESGLTATLYFADSRGAGCWQDHVPRRCDERLVRLRRAREPQQRVPAAQQCVRLAAVPLVRVRAAGQRRIDHRLGGQPALGFGRRRRRRTSFAFAGSIRRPRR